MTQDTSIPDTSNQGIGEMTERDITKASPVTIDNKEIFVEKPRENLDSSGSMKIFTDINGY